MANEPNYSSNPSKDEPKKEKVRVIPLEYIDEFPGHPFKVLDDESIAISLWSAITLKQDMRYMCEELIATATSTGKVGEEVEQRFAELCEETGITPTVTWNTTYYNAAKKQVQLGEIITCTLTHEITLQGFGTFTLPFSVTVTQSGLSRVYWK